jgi:hypothetical protein
VRALIACTPSPDGDCHAGWGAETAEKFLHFLAAFQCRSFGDSIRTYT